MYIYIYVSLSSYLSASISLPISLSPVKEAFEAALDSLQVRFRGLVLGPELFEAAIGACAAAGQQEPARLLVAKMTPGVASVKPRPP